MIISWRLPLRSFIKGNYAVAQGLHIKKQVVITLDIAAVKRSKKYVQLVMDFSKKRLEPQIRNKQERQIRERKNK